MPGQQSNGALAMGTCHFATQASSLMLFGGQFTNIRTYGALRFAFVQSSRQATAPFASISSGRFNANPLLSISRASDTSSGTESGSSGASSTASSANGAGSSSGYDSSSDTGYSSDLLLDKVHCQLCSQPLSADGSQGGPLWRRRTKKTKSGKSRGNILGCDCCQRFYHERCCQERGISTKENKGVWYHSSDCRECQQGLQQQVNKGAIPLPNNRSWQLIDCSPVSSKSPNGLKALQQLKKNLGDVLDVLLPTYGPGVAQQLVDTTKGYAVMLRQGSTPVTAGLLDVYGRDLAVLDLVATLFEEQGKGHCTALVQALEHWLGPDLKVSSLMAVCPAKEPETIRTWQQQFGFKRLNQRQLKQLQSSLAPLNYYEDSVLLTKPLSLQGGAGHGAKAVVAAQPSGQQ